MHTLRAPAAVAAVSTVAAVAAVSTVASSAAFASPAAPREHALTLTGAVRPGVPSRLTTADLLRDVGKLHAFDAPRWQREPPQRFEGVRVADLVRTYGRPGVVALRVVATNAYDQTLTPDDWEKHGALLAFRSDGAPIPTRRRGTLRIVFDYATHARLDPRLFDAKWVWQVDRVEFVAGK